jgi:hypothetical protein
VGTTRRIGSAAMVAMMAIGASMMMTLVAPSDRASAVHFGVVNGAIAYPVEDGIRLDYQPDEFGDFRDYTLPWQGAHDLEWTPDGQFLAYSVPSGPEPGIHLANVHQCTSARLTTNALDRAPSFDETHLYFTRGAASLELDYDIYEPELPISGTPAQSGYGTDMAVSVPSGRYAYVLPPAAGHAEHYLLMLDDTVLRDAPVEVHRSTAPITGTEWSADGDTLAFEAIASDGSTQIFLADVVGDPIDAVQLSSATPNALSPAFSPDGRGIAHIEGPASLASGDALLETLIGGDQTLLSEAIRGRIDWQTRARTWMEADYPPPGVSINNSTGVTLAEPSVGPGLHFVRVTTETGYTGPTPVAVPGTVAIVVDGGEPMVVDVDDSGTVEFELDLDLGEHTITASYSGGCRFRPSTGELTLQVFEDAGFTDIAESPFKTEIEWLVEARITSGCQPNRFCPLDYVAREQLASFLVRALELPPTTTDYFIDDESSTHEQDINSLAAAGITLGCRTNSYCPGRFVTRQMLASYLSRALELPTATADYFWDDHGSAFEADINRLAEASLTNGCGPARFCPGRLMTREQMAAFLYRALATP